MDPVILSEEDTVRWIAEFLFARGLVGAGRAVEREAGVCVEPPGQHQLRFLRDLILDGRWANALQFLKPLEGQVAPEVLNGLRYVLLKQQYLELVAYDPHTADHPLDEWVSASGGAPVVHWNSGTWYHITNRFIHERCHPYPEGWYGLHVVSMPPFAAGC